MTDLRGASIRGTAGADTVDGVVGVPGQPSPTGEEDSIAGGPRDDLLAGLGGDDVLVGGAGADTLSGGPGDDFVNGGAGADSLSGGAGDDVYRVDSPGDVVIEDDGAGGDPGGYDTVRSLVSWRLDAPALQGRIEALLLIGTANAAAVGTAEADMLGGNAGANTLEGGAGDDRLVGREGDDILIGGAGRDRLLGGPGADIFVLGVPDPASLDRILDFEPGFDLLRVAAPDPALPPGALDPAFFALGTPTSDAHGQFLYDTLTGVLAWDADGSAAGSETALARLTPGLALTAAHLLIA